MPQLNLDTEDEGDLMLRILAWVIDLGCVAVVVGILSELIGQNFLTLPFGGKYLKDSPLYLITVILYYGALEGSAKAATFGKLVVGLRTTDVKGQRLTFSRSFLRAACRVLSFTTIIGVVIAFFDDKHRTLHDHMAGTLVLEQD